MLLTDLVPACVAFQPQVKNVSFSDETKHDTISSTSTFTSSCLSPCRPVVLDVVFQRHALVEESGGGTVNRGAGVQGLHAAHAGALCWSFHGHLHLPPLLWSR